MVPMTIVKRLPSRIELSSVTVIMACICFFLKWRNPNLTCWCIAPNTTGNRLSSILAFCFSWRILVLCKAKKSHRRVRLRIGFFRSDWWAIWISSEGWTGKYERKKLVPQWRDCDLLNLDSYPSNAFDTTVSATSQNTNQSSKSAQSIRNF